MNHPVTGEPFDYQKCCNTCARFTDKTRTNRGTKYRTTECAVDPEHRNLAEADSNTVWKAMPACTKHVPKHEKPRQP